MGIEGLGRTGNGRYFREIHPGGGSDYFFQTGLARPRTVGERCHVATRKDVPFSIYIDSTPFDINEIGSVYAHFTMEQKAKAWARSQLWNAYSQDEKIHVSQELFALANSVLHYLSGGLFSLSLQKIQVLPKNDFWRFQIEPEGFSLNITHEYIMGSSGRHAHSGVFLVYARGLFTPEERLTAHTLIHEMGHCFFGPGHDEGEEGNGIFSGVVESDIGVNTEQAFLLSWPLMPPTNCTVKLPDAL